MAVSARDEIGRILERSESVAGSRMNDFPRKIQTVLEDDVPRLIRLALAAAKYRSSWRTYIQHAEACSVLDGYCTCGAWELQHAVDSFAIERAEPRR